MKYQLETNVDPRTRRKYGKRLLKLADLLKSLKPKQYDHSVYIRNPEEDEEAARRVAACGTVGCALGHAAVNNKMFPGLDLSWNLWFRRRNGNPLGEITEVFEANEFFGADAYGLIFSSSAYDKSHCDVKRAEVIKRIRKVAAEKWGVTAAA